MIVDTEEFLYQRLGEQGPSTFPDHTSDLARHALNDGQGNGRSHANGVRHAGACGKRGSCMSLVRGGTLIAVRADEHGHVDRAHVSVLVNRLFPLSRDWRRDDVLLDLTGVRSVVPLFVSVVESLGRYLAGQDRHIFLYNVGRHDGRLAHVSELKRIAHRPECEAELVDIAWTRCVGGFESYPWS